MHIGCLAVRRVRTVPYIILPSRLLLLGKPRPTRSPNLPFLRNTIATKYRTIRTASIINKMSGSDNESFSQGVRGADAAPLHRSLEEDDQDTGSTASARKRVSQACVPCARRKTKVPNPLLSQITRLESGFVNDLYCILAKMTDPFFLLV